MSLGERARYTAESALPGAVLAGVVTGVRRGRAVRRRVGEVTSQAVLDRLLRRTASMQEASRETATMLPELERRVAELEQEAALVAERFLAARRGD